MALRRVSRVGLLARLGFAGAAGAAALMGLVSWEMHRRSLDAAPRQLADAGPAGAAAAAPAVAASARMPGSDGIDRLLGVKASAASLASVDVTGSLPPQAATVGLGPVTRLPMPRFVSLKTDKVNVRQGPTRDQTVSFIFQRAGLPVEIVAEFENWRRIRDSEGSEGWVLQNLLSGRRTALVAPWMKDQTVALRGHADAAGGIVAYLQPGVQAAIRACAGDWCRIKGDGFDGWIEQNKLWGAYPGEPVD